MYERMLDRSVVPDEAMIQAYVGTTAWKCLMNLEAKLKEAYDLQKELRFPFGNTYGWGYKYSHKAVHLCYAFFEKEAVTIMLQIGDRQLPALELILSSLSEEAQELWKHRYPCGEQGGWVQLHLFQERDIHDAIQLLYVKKKPKKKTS